MPNILFIDGPAIGKLVQAPTLASRIVLYDDPTMPIGKVSFANRDPRPGARQILYVISRVSERVPFATYELWRPPCQRT